MYFEEIKVFRRYKDEKTSSNAVVHKNVKVYYMNEYVKFF